jgi:hypothetical protein
MHLPNLSWLAQVSLPPRQALDGQVSVPLGQVLGRAVSVLPGHVLDGTSTYRREQCCLWATVVSLTSPSWLWKETKEVAE